MICQKELVSAHSSQPISETVWIIMHEDTWHLVSKVKYYMDSGSVSSITIQKGKNIVYWLIVVEKTMAINQKAVWFIHLCMLIRELARNSIAGLDHEYDVNILLCRDCTVSFRCS